MLGNDVVDLGDPGTREGATHPRFDARVLARSEREALAREPAPRRLRWALWAAKEAAYKAAKKRDPRTVFSPRRFVVALRPARDGGLEGAVRHGRLRLAVRVEVGADAAWVHALAGDPLPEPGALCAGLLELAPDEADAGRAVRDAARRALAPRLGVDPGGLVFVREGRVPRLRLHGAPAAVDVSLSHHGRFAAFAAAPLPAAGAPQVFRPAAAAGDGVAAR